MSVLEELIAKARERASALPPLSHDGRARERRSFAGAISGRDRLSVVAEFKRRSPSEGGIADGATVVDQLQVYIEAGASAASVLTEPSRFGGSSEDLRDAASAVRLPILMKDFVVDERQVQHASELHETLAHDVVQ